jgi:hypothetical protein
MRLSLIIFLFFAIGNAGAEDIIDIRNRYSIPGLAAAGSINGEVMVQEYSGLSRIDKNILINADTKFHLGGLHGRQWVVIDRLT